MAKNKTIQFIYEQTTTVSCNDIQILEESEIVSPTGHKVPKVVFASRLQESNVRNNNRRIYDDLVCESIVSQLSPKASKRGLLMEVDHPIVTSLR